MNFITIHHPDLPGQTAQVTRKSFEKVYKPKGWLETQGPTGFVTMPLTGSGNIVPEHSAPVLDDPTPPEEDAPQSIEE